MADALFGPDQRPLILLFYDGYERTADDGVLGAAYSHSRRIVRLAYKAARRQQPRTGFYTWFLMLRRALEHAGADVRVNDFARAKHLPHHPIGAAGYPPVLDKIAHLRNPRLIGPGVFTSPLEFPALFDDPRNALTLFTCGWHADVFRPSHGDRIRRWFGGFDVSEFADASNAPKQQDVLIYDKIYFDRDRFYAGTIGPFIAMLEARGLTYKVLRYGQHHYRDYIAAVQSSRCMAFFAHQETQGMAYQECLASNVPIFAWDEGVWPSPIVAELGRGPIACTSTPYFDSRCGATFTMATMLDAWDEFFGAIGSFAPRSFIAETLTLERSAALYLRAYRETAAAPR